MSQRKPFHPVEASVVDAVLQLLAADARGEFIKMSRIVQRDNPEIMRLTEAISQILGQPVAAQTFVTGSAFAYLFLREQSGGQLPRVTRRQRTEFVQSSRRRAVQGERMFEFGLRMFREDLPDPEYVRGIEEIARYRIDRELFYSAAWYVYAALVAAETP